MLQHRQWLTDLSFRRAAQHMMLRKYRGTIAGKEQRIDRLTEQLRQLAPTWRWAIVVAALQSLHEVPFVAAVALVAELGDLTRSRPPREPMAYPGHVPSDHSTEPSVRRDGITKAGDPHLRRLLGGSTWAHQGVPCKAGHRWNREPACGTPCGPDGDGADRSVSRASSVVAILSRHQHVSGDAHHGRLARSSAQRKDQAARVIAITNKAQQRLCR
jgi:hypothetical protein